MGLFFMLRCYLFRIRTFVWGFIIILVSGCASFGPGGGADKAYNLGEYSKAAEFYNKQYKKEKNKYTKGEISFKMGECYRKINLPSKAITPYKNAVKYNYEDPVAKLYLGQCLLKTGKPDKAKEVFEEYLVDYPSDLLAQAGLKSCELAMKEAGQNRYDVERINEIRSRRYSDYSPSFGGTENDIVIFSSMRHEGKRKGQSKINGQGTSNIYTTRLNAKGKWIDPEPLEEPINSQFDDGATSITQDGREMYYTRCMYEKDKEMAGEIFVVKREGGRWGEPEKVALGGDSLLFAHPAISPDKLTLYYVSDMEGGSGGKDIWRSVRKSDGAEWSEPVNLGTLINTAGDEMFPTIDENGTLYFSSDGHPGFGGLDIYKVTEIVDEDSTKQSFKLVHLPKPINSDADDFGMVFKAGTNEGMFTSSRDNARGMDNIYKFVYHPITYSLKGQIVDEKTEEPVDGAYIRMVGSDGTMQKLELLPESKFSTPLKPNTDYVFLVAAQGYLNQKLKVTTVGLDDDKEFDFKIGMVSKRRPVILEDISYDAGGFAISNKIAAALDRLYDILSDNPQVKIEIGSHTDSEGDETDNIILSQKRAEAIMNYLSKKGLATERIVAKGYGESQPVTVDAKMEGKYNFLNEGDVLTPNFIDQLRGRNKTIANSLNRRTEFKVISE